MRLTPDCAVAAKVFPSPNHGERRDGLRPEMLILHYTGMRDGPEALERLCNPVAEVSAHYLVWEDGRILQLVPEGRRAHHAGLSSWAGLDDLNSRSIGIEIVNAGHAGGLPPFPDRQIEAVTALARDIAGRWSVRPDRVLAHSDIAPDRKEDPGERFPWDRLHAGGVGHWVPPAPIRDGLFLAEGDAGQPVEALQAMFALYGYDLPITGRFDARLAAVATAFQRHFRPERVDGVADASTVRTLRDLIAARGGPA